MDSDYGLTMNLYGHVVDDTKSQVMNDIRIDMVRIKKINPITVWVQYF